MNVVRFLYESILNLQSNLTLFYVNSVLSHHTEVFPVSSPCGFFDQPASLSSRQLFQQIKHLQTEETNVSALSLLHGLHHRAAFYCWRLCFLPPMLAMDSGPMIWSSKSLWAPRSLRFGSQQPFISGGSLRLQHTKHIIFTKHNPFFKKRYVSVEIWHQL